VIVDRPATFEEGAEAAIRDEIASVFGPGGLAGFEVKVRRDPDHYDLLRLVVFFGESEEEVALLHLGDPAVRANPERAIRQATCDLLDRLALVE
jgi:hypothetical protein